jgi:PPOX class probable F420-dependent enzyme
MMAAPPTRKVVDQITVTLPDTVIELLQAASPCFVATTFADGSPQVTETWVDTDGAHVLLNTVDGHAKLVNLRRDPRLAVAVADRDEPSRYVELRGRVVSITTEGAVDHIEALALRYTGRPYQWYGGRDQVRVVLTIEVDRINAMLH